MDKVYMSQEEYDKTVDKMRDQYGYDEMSEEEQAAFDERLDKAVGVWEEGEEGEETEGSEGADESDDAEDPDSPDSEREQMKAELRERYGYDEMSDEKKAQFDQILDDEMDAMERGEPAEKSPLEQEKEKYREQWGYDDMSEEEQADFDKRLDEAIGSEDEAEKTDSAEKQKVLR